MVDVDKNARGVFPNNKRPGIQKAVVPKRVKKSRTTIEELRTRIESLEADLTKAKRVLQSISETP